MSYTVSLQKRIQQLKKAGADLPKVLRETQKGATLRAIEAAQDATPPKMNSLRGTNTRTGELKAHWATDSEWEPRGGGISGGTFQRTVLANNMEYASYVNDGHRVKRHFVPGLYINSDGVLEYDPAARGYVGLVVGTKTSYVKGEFMVDKAKAEYERVVLFELDKEIQRLMK